MSSLKSISSKLSFLVLGVGGGSSIPKFVGSATPQSESFHSDAIKQEKKKVFDKNQRFQGGGCHYWVKGENVKARMGEDEYNNLDKSDAKVTHNGNSFWVVYSVGSGVSPCYSAGQKVNYDIKTQVEGRVDFLLSSLNLKNGKREKDTVVMRMSMSKNNKNKWSAVKNGWAGKAPFWKNNSQEEGASGWYPAHSILCIPKDKTISVEENKILNGGYNPSTGKCSLNAIDSSVLKEAERQQINVSEGTIIGKKKRSWAQKWWDDLTWLELK